MARVRLAIPCSARRTNGEKCKNYAMTGAAVCHAHGGRAPQVRQAANRRMLWGKIRLDLAQWEAQRDAEIAAVAPWAPELTRLRMVKSFQPAETAERFRQIATEMTSVARGLRTQAKTLEEMNSSNT